MNYRDYLQQLIYKIINPLIHGMIKIGITPNFITTTGFILNVVAAGMFVYAGICGGQNDLSILGWAGGVILFAGLFDMMDGRVARLGNMSSKFGALYDSVLDRYSELMTFFGICYYLSVKDYFIYAIIAFVALIGSLMVSYVRARAEGLGIECKVGFMQRPERVVLTSLGALFCGVFKDITAFDPMLILMVPLTIVAVFANITAFARVRHCYKVMTANEKNSNAVEERNPDRYCHHGSFSSADSCLYRTPFRTSADGGTLSGFIFCRTTYPEAGSGLTAFRHFRDLV